MNREVGFFRDIGWPRVAVLLGSAALVVGTPTGRQTAGELPERTAATANNVVTEPVAEATEPLVGAAVRLLLGDYDPIGTTDPEPILIDGTSYECPPGSSGVLASSGATSCG